MRSPSGTFNLLEIYADRKGNLTTKTHYKTKKDVSQRTISIKDSLHSTPEADGTTSLRNKLKADKVLFIATNLDASRQTSLEDSTHPESEDVIADLSEPSQSDAATDASKPQAHNKNGSGLINAEAQAQPSADKGIKKSEPCKEKTEKSSEARILFSIAWHGSPADFTEFEERHYREGVGSFHRPGFYFASDEKSAKPYAYDHGNGP